MRYIIAIIGLLWCILGVANILMSGAFKPGAEILFSFVIIFNFVLFVFPGLVLFGIFYKRK